MTEFTTDVEPYRWMFERTYYDWKDPEITGHHAWLFKDLREAYEDLRETANTFQKATLVGHDRVNGLSHAICGMLQYLGSWKQPDRYTSSAHTAQNWVNHRGRWATKYSDAAVDCPCGALKYYTENRKSGEDFDQPHTDDCTPIHRHRTNMLIWQQRRRIIHQSALNHLRQTRVAERMGLTKRSVSSQCRLMDIDYEALRAHGFRKWRATMITLREEFDMYNRDLSDIFGYARSTIRDHLNENLDIYENNPRHRVRTDAIPTPTTND